MVKRTSTLLVVTIGFLFQAVGCSDPAEELCDQPEGGGSDEIGDDGLGMSLEHTDALPPEESGFTSPDPQGSTALAHETRSTILDVWLDNPPMLFRFNVFPGRSKLAILNGGAWAVERVIWNPFPETQYNDYALLILEDDIDRSGQYGRLGLCSASNNTLDGLPVATAGYPGSTYKCGQTPDPPNADSDCPCGGWMYTQSCEISYMGPQELITYLRHPARSIRESIVGGRMCFQQYKVYRRHHLRENWFGWWSGALARR